MKYLHLTPEQQKQEQKGRALALERKHFLRTLDLKEAQALAESADAATLKDRMVAVGQIMLDLQQIELSLQALNGK